MEQNVRAFDVVDANASRPRRNMLRQSLDAVGPGPQNSPTRLESVALVVAVIMALYPLGIFTWGVYFGPAAP